MSYEYDYTWKVDSIKVQDQTLTDGEIAKNAIVQTTWSVRALYDAGDGNYYEATFYGATPFSATELSSTEFVDFNNLTEVQVLKWIQDYSSTFSLEGNPITEHMKKVLDNEIELQIKPVLDKEPPWSAVEPSIEEPVGPEEGGIGIENPYENGEPAPGEEVLPEPFPESDSTE